MFGATRKTEPKKPTFSVLVFDFLEDRSVLYIRNRILPKPKKPTRPEPKNRMPSPTCRAAPFVVFFLNKLPFVGVHIIFVKISFVSISYLLYGHTCSHSYQHPATLHPVSLISPPPQLHSQAAVQTVEEKGNAASENGRIVPLKHS